MFIIPSDLALILQEGWLHSSNRIDDVINFLLGYTSTQTGELLEIHKIVLLQHVSSFPILQSVALKPALVAKLCKCGKPSKNMLNILCGTFRGSPGNYYQKYSEQWSQGNPCPAQCSKKKTPKMIPRPYT